MDKTSLAILVIDDDEDDYILASDLLSEIEGMSVTTEWIPTFDEGLATIKEDRHDIYLLDYRLGSRDGLQLLNEAIAFGCTSPLILLTGQGDREVDVKAMEAGAADFLVKGQISSQMLERSIRYSLDRSKTREKLSHLAQYDELTGLPNRNLFHDRLEKAISVAQSKSNRLALLFLDLDRFKLVNDTYGHDAGDQLLKDFSARISRCIREVDMAARLGGDEFVIILGEIDDSRSAVAVAERIIHAMKPPCVLTGKDLAGQEIQPCTSIGIAIYPFDGTNGESLLKSADTAMYRAKNTEGSCYEFYSEDNNDGTKSSSFEVSSGLHRAQERDEFFLEYQPIYTIEGEPSCIEALLRWKRDQGEQVVMPGSFLPVLEETGMIISVGEWILESACNQLLRLKERGLADMRLSVNFSARQLRQPGVVDMISRIIASQGIKSHLLDIEITEDSMMHHYQDNIEIFKRLCDIGVGLSLDDFGTGHSSLSSLKHFPISRLKIARAFIANVMEVESDAAISRAIISLAHNLKMKVVAVGVESEGQLEFLKNAECDEVQGRYFSPPVVAELLEELLIGKEKMAQ
ncbi:MAG: EAL domain-containing protein [Proteobacteria bacterium]|nr:EAL domain-containing protein [Pseudomonadota bacterium]MBU1739258.1 EAL domain-containing protein [Pseudomonadota bacterium]